MPKICNAYSWWNFKSNITRYFKIHPWKLTWRPKITRFQRSYTFPNHHFQYLSETSMFQYLIPISITWLYMTLWQASLHWSLQGLRYPWRSGFDVTGKTRCVCKIGFRFFVFSRKNILWQCCEGVEVWPQQMRHANSWEKLKDAATHCGLKCPFSLKRGTKPKPMALLFRSPCSCPFTRSLSPNEHILSKLKGRFTVDIFIPLWGM